MTKVTNNHNAPLSVANVQVRPGATVEVDEEDFKSWSLGNAAAIWLKQGLVESDTEAAKPVQKKTTTVETTGGGPLATNLPTERQVLEGRAAALGIDFSTETKDEDLLNATLEAEQEAAKGERDALIIEARELGLNPNANIGVDKLKEQIATKKASR